jgi:hypothetical protein
VAGGAQAISPAAATTGSSLPGGGGSIGGVQVTASSGGAPVVDSVEVNLAWVDEPMTARAKVPLPTMRLDTLNFT